MRWRRAIVAVVVGMVVTCVVYAVSIPYVLAYVQEVILRVFPRTGFWRWVPGIVTMTIINVPGMVAAMLIYGTGKQPNDSHTHCVKCNYILKGLTEPRCPECGERILSALP